MTDQLSPERVEDERRLFEAAERRLHPRLGSDPEPDFGRTRTDGIYYIVAREHRWQGWLARASIQPVVTEAMVQRGAWALVKHDEYEWDKQQYEAKENAKDQARACLTAALSPHGERVDG